MCQRSFQFSLAFEMLLLSYWVFTTYTKFYIFDINTKKLRKLANVSIFANNAKLKQFEKGTPFNL